MPVTTMSLWISISNILYSTRNTRKAPLIPEGFVLETPPELKATVVQLKSESPTFHSTLPTISQSPVPSPASSILDIPLGPVISTGNDSTETLVNVASKPGSPTSILQLYPLVNEAMQMRHVSFADCVAPLRPVEPLDVTDMAQVLSNPSAAAAGTPERAKPLRENVPNMEKKSKRKRILWRMSLLAPRTSGTKARRFSVTVFSSLTDVTSKRASKRP
ncbi:hypothetical protein BDR07DRAFT_1394347 [Suillus spraguei]|nr:hypothetical protein BDR07DRAFT_1394347 [Suillus spraguei]